MIAPWVLEALRTLPGLVGAYGPGGALAARTRQRVTVAVSEANGCHWSAWVHGAWRDLLGEADPEEADEIVLQYARACAAAGRPLPTDGLAEHLPPLAVGAVRATVANVSLANEVEAHTRHPLLRLAVAPLAAPALGAAVAMRALHRLAPPLPVIDQPQGDDANLLVHVLGRALPSWLAHAGVRLALLGTPLHLVVGVRAGRSAATVRLGRGRVAIENGLAPDVALVVEGDVEPLLQLATGSLLRDLRAIRLRGG